MPADRGAYNVVARSGNDEPQAEQNAARGEGDARTPYSGTSSQRINPVPMAAKINPNTPTPAAGNQFAIAFSC
ncbi:MAG TPA: hypothetical protein VMP01_03070 [Pirellulaceae bacterium]|nr:hypothetical protein [Pirellulaceae bacterium]